MIYDIKHFVFAAFVLFPGFSTAAEAVPEQRRAVASAVTDADRVCLAQTIYFEARDQPLAGRRAVAAVVLNRVRSAKFPATICGVVHQKNGRNCQFSWWCDGRSDQPRDRQSWDEARHLADTMVDGPYDDPTGGALFFFHHGAKPRRILYVERVAVVGAHLFYR